MTMAIDQASHPYTSVLETDGNPVAFFEAVHQTFQQAKQVMGEDFDRFYCIGGHTMQLRFAGPALVPRITPALQHLATAPDASPALTVCIWDSVSTLTQMPPPPWAQDAYVGRGEVYGYNDGRMHTNFNLASYVLSMLDTSSALAMYWTRDPNQLPYYESGAPLREILNWWLSEYGYQFCHAGAVGTDKKGVLLAGRGGSGKSTTALTCLNSELVYASDDYCLLATDPCPYVYSLYNTAKVDADNIHRIPHLKSAISNADRLDAEKALLFLHQHFPDRIVKGFPIRAVLLPRVTGRRETVLTPASPAAGLMALAPSTMFQLSGADQKAFRAISRLLKQVPCYNLELGTDLEQVPDVILGLLRED